MADPKFPEEVEAAMKIAEKMQKECSVEYFAGERWYYLTGGSFDYCKGFIDGGAEGWRGSPLRIVCDEYILYLEGMD